MAALLTMTFINEFRDEGFETGYFLPGTVALLNEAEKMLLARIRPQAIPLAEAHLVIDYENFLMSSIGNWYGDIYETNLEWAKNSKMNQTEDAIPVGHDKYIRPILMGKL